MMMMMMMMGVVWCWKGSVSDIWWNLYLLTTLVSLEHVGGVQLHLQFPGDPSSSSPLATSSESPHLLENVGIAAPPNPPQALQQFLSPYTQQSTLTPIPSGPAEGPAEDVVSVLGGVARLPCDLTQPGDSPMLVLVSSVLTGRPVYSIDARDRSLETALHWSSLGDRAHFDLSIQPQTLIIRNIEADDQAEYRCRVDFRSSPTRNLRVRLLVMVPPQKITISTTESRKPLTGVIGPFGLGTHLSLTCTVIGGRPPPRVTWWHEGSLLDEVSEQVTDEVTRNTLTLPNLSRHHLNRVITCKASNSNRTRSINASITLDMTFPPVEVRIINKAKVMKEGGRYSLVCEASGSRPPVSLSWWVDGVLMTDTEQQTSKDGNVSRATLRLKPTRESDGAVVLCRALNPSMPAIPMEDIIKLNVQYAPKLQLRAGQNLVMTNIKEGDDVYFECDIQANPRVQVVRWFLDEDELHHNVSGGIIQSNQSLVLQGVTRSSSGLYVCQATNVQDTTTSSPILLTVKYAPVCVERQKWTYGIGRRESVTVNCSVEAFPQAQSFRWAFNSTTELVHMPKNASKSEDNRSNLLYTPITHHDFGTVLCWADNEVGRQAEPCVYLIVPAAVPEPVQNCSAWQDSSRAGELVVACFPGWSGGLTQVFTLRVTQHSSRNSINSDKALTIIRDQKDPYFTISGLKAGMEYYFTIVATNAHGTSQPTLHIHHMPIDVAEKRTSAAAAAAASGGGSLGGNQAMALTPILGVVAGVVATIIICSIVVVMAIRARLSHASGNQRQQHLQQQHMKCIPEKAALHPKSSDDGGFTQLKRGPDLILVKGGNQEERQLMELYPGPLSNTYSSKMGLSATSTSGMLTLCKTSINIPSSDINPSSGTIITHPTSSSSIEPISSAIIHTYSDSGSGSGCGGGGGGSSSGGVDGGAGGMDSFTTSPSSSERRGYRASSISASTAFPPYTKGTLGRSVSCSERAATGGVGGVGVGVGVGMIEGGMCAGEGVLAATIPHSSSYSCASSYPVSSSFTLPRQASSSSASPSSSVVAAATLARQASSSALYRDFTPADLNTSRESCV